MPSEFKNLSDKVAAGSKEVSGSLHKMMDSAKKVDISQKKLTATQIKALKISDKYRKSVEKLRKESLKLRKENIQVAKTFTALGRTGTRTYLQTVINKVEELHKGMTDLSKSMKLVSPRIKIEVTGLSEAKKVKESVKEIKEETESLKDAFDKTEASMGWASRQFKEGADDAEDFAKGLGGINGRLVAAGAGAAYLANKTANLLKEFESARMSLAKYGVTTALAGKTTRGFSKEGLERLRKNLSLTREQAGEYFKVVQEGTNILGLTPAKIEAVSNALQKTFGGDPTDRLREYIDLLKEIPTLDVDLSITSSMDDQTAAIFALAQKGKMEAVIDLQTAGLLGGGAPTEASPTDVKQLNAQQKTMGATERINDTMLRFYPEWGSQFSAVVDYGAKAVAVASSSLASIGAMGFFAKKAHVQTMAQMVVIGEKLDVIAARALLPGKGIPGKVVPNVVPPKGPGKLMPGVVPPKTLKASLKAAGGMEKAGAATSKFALTIGKFAKIGTGVGIALAAAGIAADLLADHFEDSGKDMAASATKGISGILETAGMVLTGAVIGSMVAGPLGTAIGAGVGALVGFAMNLEKIGEPIEKFGKNIQGTTTIAGKSVQRFGKIGQSAGKFLEVYGHGLGETGKYLKYFGKTAWGAAKTLLYWGSGIGAGVTAFKTFVSWIETPAYKKAYAEAAASADSLNEQMKKAVVASRQYEKAREEYTDGENKSNLALQAHMEMLKAEFNSAKFALADFMAGLASVKIDALSEAGGSADAFSDAVGAASYAVKMRFDLVGKAVDSSRKKILQDASLQGPARRESLMLLHKEELIATKAFVDGMAQAIEALYKSPKIIQEGLKAQIAKIKIDVGLEIGGMTGTDFLKESQNQISATESRLEELYKAQEESEVRLAQLRQELTKTAEDDAQKLGSEVVKALESKGVVKVKRTEKGDVEKVEFQKKPTADYSKEHEEYLRGLEKEFNRLKTSLPAGSLEEVAAAMTDAKNNTKKYKDILDSANKKLKKAYDATEDVEGIDKAEKAAKSAKKRFEDAGVEQKKVAIRFRDFIKGTLDETAVADDEVKKNLKPFQETLMNVLGSISEGKPIDAKDVADSQEAVAAINAGLGKTTEELVKGKETFKKMQSVVEKITEASDIEDALRKQLDGLTGENKILDQQRKGAEEIATTRKELNNAEMEIAKIMEVGEVSALKAELTTLEEAQARASLLGDPTEAVSKSMAKQNEIFSETLKQADIALGWAKDKEGKAQDQLNSAKEETRLAKEAAVVEGKVSTERLTAAENEEAKAKESLVISKNAVANVKKRMTEVLKTLPKIGEQIAKGIQEFNDSFSGQEIVSRIDLSSALMEFAEFSSDTAKYAKEATSIGIKAAKDRYEAEKRSIAAYIVEEDKLIESRVKLAGPGASPQEIARIRAEGENTKNAVVRSRYAKNETEMKRSVFEYAQKEADLKIQVVDATQSALEAEMEVASMRGYHMSVMADKQKEILSMEVKRVEAVREQLEKAKAAGDDSQRTQLLSLQLRQAEANLQKKSLGYQRDIMEKMVGAALGEVRAAVGARKRRLTDVGLMGVAETRVKTATGAYTGAGPGGVKPYWQRLAEYQAGGKTGGAGRLKPEQEMAKGLLKTSKNTASTAKAVKNMDDNSRSPGSLYTHDMTTEGLLASILYVAKEVAVGIAEMGLGEAPTKDDKDIRSKLEKGLEGVRSEIESRSKKAEIISKNDEDTSEEMEKVQKKEAVLQKKQFKQEKIAVKDIKTSSKTAEENLQTAKQELEMAKSTGDSTQAKQEAVLKAQYELKDTLEREIGKSQEKQETAQVKTVSALDRVKKAQEATDISRLGRPGKVKTIGQTFAAFRGGDRGLMAPDKGIKRMGGAAGKGLGGKMGGTAMIGFGDEKKAAKTMGDTVASAVEAPPMTGVETAKIAEATRSFDTAGRGGAGAFAAKPGLAGGGAAGGAAETSSMKVEGKMTVHFDYPAFKSEVTKVVVEVIRTPDVLKGLQKAGVPFM